MSIRSRLLLLFLLVSFVPSDFFAFRAWAEPRVRLVNHVPKQAIAHAKHLGRLSGDRQLSLSVAIKLPDEDGLKNFINHATTTGDPLYGKFLQTGEFAKKFATSDDNYAALLTAFKNQGFSVASDSGNKTLIHVQASVATIESALNLEMHAYQALDGRTVFAPTSDPSVPASVAGKIHGIIGLNSFAKPRTSTSPAANPGGTGPSGTLKPADIKTAYDLGSVSLSGSGETIAIFELSGYNTSDVTAYAQAVGLSQPPSVTNVLVDGATGAITDPDLESEADLDLDLIMALAPGSNILVYETPYSQQSLLTYFADGFSRMAADNLATEISVSLVSTEDFLDAGTLQSLNASTMQMAAQGQSIFICSGDFGAYENAAIAVNPPTLSISGLASLPYVVAVGGTTLTLTAGQGYAKETSWSEAQIGQKGQGGGGISQLWNIPHWQTGLASAANLGSNFARMIPDVSLNADSVVSPYLVYINGQAAEYGGTSAATPLWAAFMALVNQNRVASGLPRLGFANPTIYRIGQSSIYNQVFHDISDGSTNGYYPAVTGYDLSTGWGSFIGSALLKALSNAILPPNPPQQFTAKAVGQ